jgi:hypothetical protein
VQRSGIGFRAEDRFLRQEVSGTKREATMNAPADSMPARNWRRL